MSNKKNKLCLTVLLLGLAAYLSSCAKDKEDKEQEQKFSTDVIYGDDNRAENYQASNSIKSLAASTVALVKSSKLSLNTQGLYQLEADSFGSEYQLCSSEPFRNQSTGAFCSGSLVGEDVVMTAGHCITSPADCADVRFVFDYHMVNSEQEKNQFKKDEVYSCKTIIKRDLQNNGIDYALIRLDRKVVGRSPLSLRRQKTVTAAESLFVIGHPAGLPQKIAGGATVRTVSEDYFVANLDTYGGNSGSAVFASTTGEVVGILVRGENDFVRQGSCYVSQKCQDSACRGEDVTRVDKVASFIPAEGTNPGPVPPTTPVEDNVYQVVANQIIQDYPAQGIASTMRVSSLPGDRKIEVKLDLTHSYRGDLLVELFNPDGQKVILHNRSGGSLDNIQGIYGQNLNSVESLSLFRQTSKTGVWVLKVTDLARVDAGKLNSWSLSFKK